ncbi:MAG: polysaccharide deacetylase family protein [Xanthomonadales bacterium]|nr:polysaccharide deacetylase family protein [Xanthomonadales bacterium]
MSERNTHHIPVLTYHSMNVDGRDYANNDHVALAADLEWLHAHGWRIVPLRAAVAAVCDGIRALPKRCCAISFDDGSWFDWHDLEHPSHGRQRGMAGILRDFRARHGAPVHATSFVIVSPDARIELDRTCMLGLGWWGHEWWPQAEAEGLIGIESHSFDHNHHTLSRSAFGEEPDGRFDGLFTEAVADAEIVAASRWLDAALPTRRTSLFAYPYGQSSAFLRTDYLPRRRTDHGLVAAFGTDPRAMSASDDRWNLPRFVCGRDWRSVEELGQLLEA